MITFIICSRSAEMAESVKRNIRATIGLENPEFIVFDNSRRGWGITKVYNHCARQARSPYLCFVHEDVVFHTRDWGRRIVEKLDEPDCGVIGFSGAPFKTKTLSPVHQNRPTCIHNLVQSGGGTRAFVNTITVPGVAEGWTTDFVPVVTLDGLCLFVRKAVWQETPFDEQILQHFHGYDLDFSLSVAERRRNYVCNCVIVEHTSQGSFSKEWALDVIKLHEEKWASRLPLWTDDAARERMEREVPDTYYQFLKNALRAKVPARVLRPYIEDYWRTTAFKSHSVSLLLKLIAAKLLRLDV